MFETLAYKNSFRLEKNLKVPYSAKFLLPLFPPIICVSFVYNVRAQTHYDVTKGH